LVPLFATSKPGSLAFKKTTFHWPFARFKKPCEWLCRQKQHYLFFVGFFDTPEKGEK